MAKEEIEYEKTVDAADVAAFLDHVAAGLRSGKVLLSEGGTSLNLDVKPPLTLEVEADFDSEKQKCSFEVKLEWRVGEPRERRRPER